MDPIRIAWLLPDGRGAGKGPDGVVRVVGAVPGDLVAVRVVGQKGRSLDGEIQELLEPSADREHPQCPWNEACGGCDLAHMTGDARRVALGRTVAHALGVDEVAVVPSPRQTAHRARIKLAISDGVVGYRGYRSHQLVGIDTCAVARVEVQAALERLRELPDGALGGAKSVELRSDGRRAAYAFDGSSSADVDAIRGLGDVAWNGRVLSGDPTLQIEVDGRRLRAGPRAFYQVNLEANALLVARVVELAKRVQPERILDLYAGIGNLTLPLVAHTGAPAVAVELEGQSLSDLRHNASAAGLSVEAIGRRVERFDPSTTPYDLAVLDPPRSGARGVLPKVLRNRPRALIYVSCNPGSAARDLREVRPAGYELTDVLAFDMFPDTHHIETVMLLERR